MKKFFSNKKFNSFFLVLVMMFSLFFFGCTDDGEKDTSYMKLIYRPYSTSKMLGIGKTYAELVEDEVLSLSEDILTELVGAYGPNSITIMDGLLPKTLKPDLNGVDYKELFGYGALGGLLSSDDDFALELGAMTNLYFSSEDKLVTLTKGEFTASDIADLLLLIPQLMIPGAALDNVQIVSGSLADLNALLRISTGDLYYYVFYGGEIAGTDYISTNNNFQNAKNYFARLFNSNYNVIEKDFVGVDIVDDSNNDLKFAHWKYNLLNGNLENQISNGNTYLSQFLEKYKVPFAAHVAKAMLVGGEDLPNDLPKEGTSLASLYEQAKQGNASKCQEFIKLASNYIDHLGLTNSNISQLLEVIKTEVIGDGAMPNEKIYENSESNILTKNNYDTIIPACLDRVLENNPAKPILEYITVEGSYTEEIVIDGYLQSVVFFSKDAKEINEFVGQLNFEDGVVPAYIATVRHCKDGSIEEYAADIESEDFNDGSVCIEEKHYGAEESLKVEDSKNTLIGEKGYILVGDLYKNFVHSSLTDYTSGHAWCFNDLENNYVEVVLATNSIFDVFKVDIECFGA